MALLNKCTWLVSTLLRSGERGLTLKEINEKWVQNDLSFGEPIPRATFDRWKNHIFDTMGILIECHNPGGYRYYISNPQDLKDGELSRWLLDTYSTFNALAQNATLKGRIIVEDIPSSHDFLTSILDAMRENIVVDLTYKGFNKAGASTFPVEPYCVRLFNKRWYLLAHSVLDDKMRLYGIDRIENVVLSKQKFTLPASFDAKDYFSSFFGIYLSEDTPVQRIVLRANKYHQHYLRTLPLHHSQKEIFACEDYADFELYLRPTYDFVNEILKVGNWIEVLEPQSLRHHMHCWVYDMWEMYKND